MLSNVIPQETHDICQKWFDGDVEGSRKLFLHYLELANALFMDVNPISVKDAMNLMGMQVGECRLPLITMADPMKEKLAAVLKKYELI